MPQMDITGAKVNLSDLIEIALSGKEVVITVNEQPVVNL